MKNFGTTDISLGEFQRLERGGKSLPLAGLPDMLATMYSMPAENGRRRGAIGDCYIAFAKFTPTGPEIETINCYGASNRKNSPHYDDQMELFQKQQTKKMTLNRDEVYMNAKAIYHPEVFSKIRFPDKLTRARR
jgi:acyl-homoserine-lactone acylase